MHYKVDIDDDRATSHSRVGTSDKYSTMTAAKLAARDLLLRCGNGYTAVISNSFENGEVTETAYYKIAKGKFTKIKE